VETLDRALVASAYRAPKGKHTGRGVAIAHWLPLGGECQAVVTLGDDGRAKVATAMVDQGAGTYTAMRQIVAEELRLGVEQVEFEILDTSRIEPDTGVGASRATRIFGNAALAAARAAREKLFEAAAKLLRVGREQLTLTGDGAVKSVGKPRIAYSEIVKALGPIRGEGSYKNFTPGPEAAVCVQVAEVEVDVDTGKVVVQRLTTSHSTGTVINPLMHQGQIDGGVVMGIGYALMEQLLIEGGRVLGTNFGENKIPTIADIPQLRTVIQELPVGNGPYGGMSIGEPPVIPAAAAIANAVHDAIGVRVYDLPITAEKVLNGLKSGSLESGARRGSQPPSAEYRRISGGKSTR